MSQNTSAPAEPMSRRRLFAGATTLGALAATATLIPSIHHEAATVPVAKAPPARGGGYTLSEHVKRYYKTALV